MLMELMGFIEGMAKVRGIWKNVISFVWRCYACQIHGLREEKRKVTFRMGENKTEIDFVFKKKNTGSLFKI